MRRLVLVGATMALLFGCASERGASVEAQPETPAVSGGTTPLPAETTSAESLDNGSTSSPPTTEADAAFRLAPTNLDVGRESIVEFADGPLGWLAVVSDPFDERAAQSMWRSDDGLTWAGVMPEFDGDTSLGEPGSAIRKLRGGADGFTLVVETWAPESPDRSDSIFTVFTSPNGQRWTKVAAPVPADGMTVRDYRAGRLLAAHWGATLITEQKYAVTAELFAGRLLDEPESGVCRLDYSFDGAGYWTCADVSSRDVSDETRVGFAADDLREPSQWEVIRECAKAISGAAGGHERDIRLAHEGSSRVYTHAALFVVEPTLLSDGTFFAMEGDFDGIISLACQALLPERLGSLFWWTWADGESSPAVQPIPEEVRFSAEQFIRVGPILDDFGLIRFADDQQVWILDPGEAEWVSSVSLPSSWLGRPVFSADGEFLVGGSSDSTTDSSTIEILNIESGDLVQVDVTAASALPGFLRVAGVTKNDVWVAGERGEVYRLQLDGRRD